MLYNVHIFKLSVPSKCLDYTFGKLRKPYGYTVSGNIVSPIINIERSFEDSHRLRLCNDWKSQHNKKS